MDSVRFGGSERTTSRDRQQRYIAESHRKSETHSINDSNPVRE
jgi:hypothetical protein